MKKIISSLVLSSAMISFAQTYNWGAGEGTLTLDSALTEVKLITIGKPNDTAATGSYNTINGAEIKFASSTNSSSLTSYTDVTFNNKVTFKNGANWWDHAITTGYADAGKTTTITFTDLHFDSNGKGGSAGLDFFDGNTGKGGVVHYKVGGTSSFSGGIITRNNVVLELCRTDGQQVLTGGTFSVQDGSKFVMGAANSVATTNWQTRTGVNAAGTHLGGIIDMNGFDFSLASMDLRNDGGHAEAGVQQIFEFGGEKGVSQTLTMTGTFNFATKITNDVQKEACVITISGYESGIDHIYFAKDYTKDAITSDLIQFDFGGEDYELIVKEISAGKFEYIATVIPEPSTYAMILGALAIAFVFMRRQTRK